jgi:hypothetical protein
MTASRILQQHVMNVPISFASDGVNEMLRKICKRMITSFSHPQQPRSLSGRPLLLQDTRNLPHYSFVWRLHTSSVSSGVQSIEIPF